MGLSGFVKHTTDELFCKCRKNNRNFQTGTNEQFILSLLILTILSLDEIWFGVKNFKTLPSNIKRLCNN